MPDMKIAMIIKLGLPLLIAAGVWRVAVLHADTPSGPTPKPAQTAPAMKKPAVMKVATSSKPANDAFVVKRVLPIIGPFRHGDYVWDDKDVPAGPIVITVDLAAQTLSVFRDGYEIGAAVILYGADNMMTPLGTFPITQKDADHWSNLYDAPMPYMLRLTNDGVAIHGSDVELGSATHGCIGVPNKFAALLFGQAKLGDRVIITRGKMMDVSGAKPAA
jgi:lipoprotein-anchoring transpeptidase ErfK/SrfK